MEEFLLLRGWSDELKIDPVDRTISLVTGVSIGNQSGRLFVEIDEAADCVDVFFYYDMRCKELNIDQMCRLINMLHLQWSFGRFEVLPDGRIRWRHRVDFEGSTPTGRSVEAIVQPGWVAIAKFLDPIAAVALTRQSADEALADWKQSQPQESPDKRTV